MSKKNTALFGAGLVLALGAITADHLTAEAPKPVSASEVNYNPCAAPMPAKKGGRNYDDIADEYSGAAPAAAPAPAPAEKPAGNPCSMGL